MRISLSAENHPASSAVRTRDLEHKQEISDTWSIYCFLITASPVPCWFCLEPLSSIPASLAFHGSGTLKGNSLPKQIWVIHVYSEVGNKDLIMQQLGGGRADSKVVVDSKHNP